MCFDNSKGVTDDELIEMPLLYSSLADVPKTEQPQKAVQVAPAKATGCEPDIYEWKDITQEFFESVEGLWLRRL